MLDLLDPRSLATRLRGLLADPQPSAMQQAEIARALDSLSAGNYARHVPAGSRTWEGSCTLDGTKGETGANVHGWTRPVHITGIVVTLDVDSASAGTMPTLDHIELALTWRSESADTEGRDFDATGEVTDDYVSAKSLVADARLYEKRVDGARPECKWRARYRRGGGVFKDAIVSVAFIGEYV